MKSEALMSSGKKKKLKSKAKSGLPIIPIILGLLIVSALLAGGDYVLGQRKTVTGYDSSVARVREAIRMHDPESVQEALKLSEIEPLVTGNPTVTRETKEGAEYAVYTWPGGMTPIGFRLKIEKNGPIEEVTELATFGAQ